MDVFDLVAKIRLDSSEYESGVGKAQGTFSKLASGVKNGLATVAKVGAAAVSAGAAGVAALAKMGVEGYAQYEQLVGGVETLFGTGGKYITEYAASVGKSVDEVRDHYQSLKRSQETVLKNADNAYKTAGLSANAYMETVTSFSASLIQSLGGDTEKAANVADMAIIDMSDNANKMGTSMEMIQNAYQGFAKQNYTMLDNLKLGYGGTKEEMSRLLDEAQKLSGIKYDISSFADIAQAIHVVQENMGIAGTTAAEAANTIQGSVGSIKAAWENLVVGMADSNANISVLITNFVDSAAAAATNLMPRIEQTLVGIGQLITALAPVIAEALPQLVEAVLPALLIAGGSLVAAIANGIVTALPAIYTALLDGVKIILVEVFGVSEEKAGEFADSVNSFFVKIKDGFLALVKAAQTDGTWLNSIWKGLINAAKAMGDFLSALWNQLVMAFNWLVERANTEGTRLNFIWKTIQTVISTAISVIEGIIKVFASVLRGDWSAAWEECQNIAKTIDEAITQIIQNMIDYVANKLDEMIQTIKNIGTAMYNAGREILTQLWDGLKSVWNSVSSWWEGLSFSKKTATVDTSAAGAHGAHATGLNYVPFDGYRAILHRGETVLTAAEARAWRSGNGGLSDSRVVSLLGALLDATVSGNAEMVQAVNADKKLSVSGRDFARLVKEYA